MDGMRALTINPLADFKYYGILEGDGILEGGTWLKGVGPWEFALKTESWPQPLSPFLSLLPGHPAESSILPNRLQPQRHSVLHSAENSGDGPPRAEMQNK